MNMSANNSAKALNALGIIGIQSANKLHAASLTNQQDDAKKAQMLKDQVAAEKAAFKERQLDFKALLDQKKYQRQEEIKIEKDRERA